MDSFPFKHWDFAVRALDFEAKSPPTDTSGVSMCVREHVRARAHVYTCMRVCVRMCACGARAVRVRVRVRTCAHTLTIKIPLTRIHARARARTHIHRWSLKKAHEASLSGAGPLRRTEDSEAWWWSSGKTFSKTHTTRKEESLNPTQPCCHQWLFVRCASRSPTHRTKRCCSSSLACAITSSRTTKWRCWRGC